MHRYTYHFYTGLITGLLIWGHPLGGLASRVRPTLPYPPTTLQRTATQAVFSPTEFYQTIRQYPDLVKLAKFDPIGMLQGTTIQPGLQATLTKDLVTKQLTTTTMMIPQGVVIAGRYRLTTAYDATGRTQSVLYVQDRFRHQLCNTVLLHGKPHVGGLAYDPHHQRIWLCSHRHGHGAIVSVSLAALRHFDPTTSIAVHYQQRWSLPTLSNASLLTYHHQALYVGQFKPGQTTLVARYPLTSAGTPYRMTTSHAILPKAVSDWHGKLPPNIQGMAFYDHYALLSQSYGPSASHLLLFKRSQLIQQHQLTTGIAILRLPPQLEQISVHHHQAQLLYETGATPYRQQQNHAIDRLISINLQRLIE
ncbi:hypothetical protein LTA00_01370 [Lactiplantibacillus plantarum]|uniref:hypothetical protein n=1 Tax=Lactiplantibacillus plantarum TaxID=1590 RepID=UPI00200634A3|nr:hypothetical protein [Lactiplantibacillus plantarum]MCK6238228.1 hypothetical protein [Lactiplantibacillus plantarum]